MLVHLEERYKGRISAQAGPLAEGIIWRMMEDARANESAGFPFGGHLTGCGCITNRIAVRSDGAIVPCSLLGHMELGRINEDRIKQIWQSNAELKRLRERINIALSAFEFCQGCGYIPYCTGNCPAMAFSFLGEINHPSPESCLKRFLDRGGRLPLKNCRGV
jgi:SynChlorMet cassette radical SAM/SPASM protein ScmE